MRVCADAGIYMDFAQGDASMETLLAFEESLAKGKFTLIVPTVTREEVYRGEPIDRLRYSKNKFSKISMPKVPAGVEKKEVYVQAEKLLESYLIQVEKVREESEKTVADIFHNHIEKLFAQAEKIVEDEQIIEAAKLRKMKHNPPGKNNDPLGDQIVWELLLQKYNDDDLVIISSDMDWGYDGLDQRNLHPLLEKEWSERSKYKVEKYMSLSSFMSTFGYKKEKKEEEQKPSLPVSIPDYAGITYAPPMEPSFLADFAAPEDPSIYSSAWQPVNVQAAPIMGVQCDRCGRIRPYNESIFLGSGYLCRNCYYNIPS